MPDKCLIAGRLQSVCPALNAELNADSANCKCSHFKQTSKYRSSGGIFYEIASRFIRDGGVVYGAAFDVNLKLIHQRATTYEELIPLCKMQVSS